MVEKLEKYSFVHIFENDKPQFLLFFFNLGDGFLLIRGF